MVGITIPYQVPTRPLQAARRADVDVDLESPLHVDSLDQSYNLKQYLISRLVIKMAVSFHTVRALNAKLKSLNAGQVGVFVGGTAGIGEFALEAFAQKIKNPKIYIVGR